MKEFRSTQEDDHEYIGLRDYLQGLDKNNNPFNCSNLRVLPEDLKLINPNRPSKLYKVGTLICIYATGVGLDRECRVESELKAVDENLEFKCRFRAGKFRAKLVAFGPV